MKKHRILVLSLVLLLSLAGLIFVGCQCKHSGGVATCTSKAICEKCNTEYGELAEHPVEETWSYSETHHWKNTTCSCNQQKDYDQHQFGTDSACAVCGAPKSIDGVIYALDQSGTYASVVGAWDNVANVTIASEYQGVPVTEVASQAFENSAITSVQIPQGVTTIGANAFYNCAQLTSVSLPESLVAIGDRAFYGCDNLQDVYVPNLIAWCQISFEMYSNPLSYCKNFYLDNQLVTDLVIPTEVSIVRDYAFVSCDSITSVTFAPGVMGVGFEAFSRCKALANISIPSSLSTFASGAFSYCTSLKYVMIPQTVYFMNTWVFIGCSTTVYCEASSQPNSWKSDWDDGIESFVEWGVSPVVVDGLVYTVNQDTATLIRQPQMEVDKLTIPASINHNNATYQVTAIGDSAFIGAAIGEITISQGITQIGEMAFYYCHKLTTVNIPSSVTTIKKQAFQSCGKLINVNLTQGLKTIGEEAFANCSLLSTFVIPNSVATIEKQAFKGCNCLRIIVVPSSVTSMGYDVFNQCIRLTIFCQATSQPTGWNSSWNRKSFPVYWAGQWSMDANGNPVPNN